MVWKSLIKAQRLDEECRLSCCYILCSYVRYNNQGVVDTGWGAATSSAVLCHKVLGAQYPNTLTSMVHLVVMYMTQDWQNEAQDLVLQVKDLCLWVLRENHPDTLWIMQHIVVR